MKKENITNSVFSKEEKLIKSLHIQKLMYAVYCHMHISDACCSKNPVLKVLYFATQLKAPSS